MRRFGVLAIGLKKMKPKKLFSKLFPSYFLISLIGLSVLLLITKFAFRNFYYNEATTSLTQKANILKDNFTNAVIKKNLVELQENILVIAKNAENRITIIAPNGIVLADSSFTPEKMDNHSKREEIKIALTGKIGKSIRYSDTLKEKHLYVAIPLTYDSKIIGVLRNGVSVDKLQTSFLHLTKNVLFWSVFLLLILTYFIFIQAKRISSPLEEMKQKLEKFASGNFHEKLEINQASTKEISSLFNAVKGMSEKLQDQFQKINKQKNEQLAVFASMLEGVITIYPNMNIYHINKAALNLFNYQKEGPVKGTPLMDVVNSKRIFIMAKQLLVDKKSVDNEFEYESGLILNVHGTILQSEETGMLGAVLVFNDITKVRELENHRKQFVANVSHELKTPLTAIQGYLETIREGDIEDKETLNKFLDITIKNSHRLKSIIEDLLALSSIEKDSEVGGFERINQSIFPVVENVISLCSDNAKKKGIEILLKGTNEKVMINLPLMEQAIINLLDNAIKYGPENSKVVVSIKKSQVNLQIIVTDTGQGIEEKHHERLFERFYSVDKARSRALGGSGLGLSIVKHIAISHGGNVRVESTFGSGSSFILELPLNQI